MQLNLLGNTVKHITEYNGNIYHFTESGVDVHRLSDKVKIAYASLSNVTCGDVNDNAIYLSTSVSGVYKLPLSSIATGGDRTADLVQQYTTSTTPSIQSNNVRSLAAISTYMVLSTDAGIDYFPNTTTAYKMTALDCHKVCIDNLHIYFINGNQAYIHGRPSGDWSLGHCRPTSNLKTNETLVQELPFIQIGTGGNATASSGDYAVLGWETTPFITLTKWEAEGYFLQYPIDEPVESEVKGMSWKGDYLAVCTTGAPYLTVYKRVGDSLLKLTVESPPATTLECDWDGTGTYLAVVNSSISPYLTIYKRDGDTITKLSDPPAVSSAATACSWSGDMLVVSCTATPYLNVYKRTGDSLSKLADPEASGVNTIQARFDSSGTYLVIIKSSNPYIDFYKKIGDSLTKTTVSTGMSAVPFKATWYGDYLYIGCGTSGYNITLYRRDGDTLTKLSTPKVQAQTKSISFVNNIFIGVGGAGEYALTGYHTGNTCVVGSYAAFTSLNSASAPNAIATIGDMVIVSGDSTTLTLFKRLPSGKFIRLPSPATLTTGQAQGELAVWGDYIAISLNSSPYINFYMRSGDSLIKLADPTPPESFFYGMGWSEDGAYLALGTNGAPYIALYRRDGNSLVKCTLTVASLGTTGYGCSWSGDYLTLSTGAAPYIHLFKRVGDDLVKLSNPPSATGPSQRNAWHGDYLVVSCNSAPHVCFYRRSGDTLVKLSMPSPLTTQPQHISWQGEYCIIVANGLYVFKLVGESMSLAASFQIPGSAVYGAFSDQSCYVVSSNTIPYTFVARLEYDTTSPLGTTSNTLATGLNTVFIGTDQGIYAYCESEQRVKTITDALGSNKNVVALYATSATTLDEGLLAYGVDDGLGSHKFGVIDMREV